jgi:transcriptional regulator with XRE-family HTH domain
MADAQALKTRFAEFLRHAMNSANLPTAAQLGAAAGIDSSMVNRWMRAKTLPSMENLRLIAPHIHVPPLQLFVVAGHVSLEESGLDTEPTPPGPPPTAEDDIMADSRLDDAAKNAIITMIRALRKEHREGEPEQRERRAQ